MNAERATLYLDPNLPGSAALIKRLTVHYRIVNKPLSQLEVSSTYIELRYAHDTEVLSSLAPLERFNGDCLQKRAAKTLFFSWYSWRNQYHVFSSYFAPGKTFLWDVKRCQHLQLPCEPKLLESTIQQLLQYDNQR